MGSCPLQRPFRGPWPLSGKTLWASLPPGRHCTCGGQCRSVNTKKGLRDIPVCELVVIIAIQW